MECCFCPESKIVEVTDRLLANAACRLRGKLLANAACRLGGKLLANATFGLRHWLFANVTCGLREMGCLQILRLQVYFLVDSDAESCRPS